MYIFKIIGKIVIAIVVLIGLYLGFMTATDYKPAENIPLNIDNNKDQIITKHTELSATTFNIGYCGLDKNQDFFMDGGLQSRSSSKEKTLENLENNSKFLVNNSPSFILLQEVDMKSTRSFKVNQYDYISKELKGYSSSYAINYKVPWVPVPLKQPHGTVKSGLGMFSQYYIKDSNRLKLPGEEKWPKQLALLDRCMIVSRALVEDNNELVIVNLHLSAYDKGGLIRKQQLGFLRDFILEEYRKGNYILVGGDFNHVIPGADIEAFNNVRDWPTWLQEMPEDFKPYAYDFYVDKTVPTNRTVDTPYVEGENYVSIIDGFLVSKNIEVLEVNGHDLGFKYSDHQPVTIKFKLK